MKVLSIESIEVGNDDLEALVRVLNLELMRTSAVPELAERAVAFLPGLERHSCENDANARFIDELRDTETAHLLEHITVELMALAGSPRSLQARTHWDFSRDGRGVFRLRIAFDDDLVALGALKEADLVVDWLYTGVAAPSLESVIERLRRLREAD